MGIHRLRTARALMTMTIGWLVCGSPTLLAQTYYRVDLMAKNLADENAVPTPCHAQSRPVVVASGQLPPDTLIVRVVADTLGMAGMSPVQFEVRLGSQT